MKMLNAVGPLLLACTVAEAGRAQAKTDTVVRTATRPVHAAVGTLVQDFSIGLAAGDEHYMLGGIGDVAVAQNGTMYVFDRSVPIIRMYNARGQYVKSIGRRGSGPGEYRSGAAIAIAKNGNLLLFDPGNARINVYTSNGDVVTHWPTLASGTGTAAGKGLLKTDMKGDTYILKPFESAWVHFDSNGKLRDTIHAVLPREELLTWSGRGQFMNRVVPFNATTIAQLSPAGYVVTGRTDRIALDLHITPGQIVSIRRNVQRKPVSAHERDSARAEIMAEFHKTAPQWSWNGPDIPVLKPAYNSFTLDADGRIWVELEEGPHKDDENSGENYVITTTKPGGRGRADAPGGFGSSCPEGGWKLYDVYEAGGRYLGQLKTPEKMEMLVMRGDYVWASACTADDVPIAVRYRINWR